jgi:hypothetical protein
MTGVSGSRFRRTPAISRAQVAGKASLKAELEAAGYTVSLPLEPNALLHLHRRRLTAIRRSSLVASVGASHIVGDDELDSSVSRGAPMLVDLWKVAPKFRWGTTALPWPLVVLPDHLIRLQDRVEHELATNPDTKGVIVAVSVPRAVVDEASDWASFVAKADSVLCNGWASSLGISSVAAFLEPATLLRFPPSETTVPPKKWEECPLPLRHALVALTIERRADLPPTPAFRKVGTFLSWKDLQAADRAGIARVALEVDLVQRPQGGRDPQAFARRALSDLVATTSSSVALPPVRALTVKGDVLSGWVDLPSALAGHLLRHSGCVRGVFTRPWLGPSSPLPFPEGFTATSHRVVWAKVSRFSDVVTSALRDAQVDFAGLVCPRKRGELGIRVAQGADCILLQRCLELDFEAKVKASPTRRWTLRASNVPLAMLDKLALLLARVDPDLSLVGHRVLRTTYDSLVADLMVEGKDLSTSAQEEWCFYGLGTRPVIVKKLQPRRPVPVPRVAVSPTGPRVVLKRPFSGAERVTWADRVRRPPLPVDGMQLDGGLDSTATGGSLPSVTPAAVPEDAEIPLRRRPKAAATSSTTPPSRLSPASASPAAPAVPAPKPPRRTGKIQSFMQPVSAPRSPKAPARPSSSSSPARVAPVVRAPSPQSSSPGVDPSRFEELITEVRRLSTALSAQQNAYVTLQTQLQNTLAECADLRLQLRASQVKRSRAHSIGATTSTTTPTSTSTGSPPVDPSGSDAAMSSAEEEPVLRRRSPTGRTTPPNV